MWSDTLSIYNLTQLLTVIVSKCPKIPMIFDQFKGHMKRYFVISLDMVFLHIKYVFEYLTTDSS